MKPMVLALLLSFTAFAQEREVVEVHAGLFMDVEGVEHQVTGGAYLSTPSLLANAKELAALRASNASLREAPVTPPTLVVLLLAGIVLAGAGGFLVGRLAK